eukprot:7035783-Prymnesium_polylepis.2
MLLIAATLKRYHEFVGGPSLDALFSEATHAGDNCLQHQYPLMSMGNDLLVGNLAIFRRSNGIAAAFACVCGGQLAHGDLIFSHQALGDN